jgi:hypothetical protein
MDVEWLALSMFDLQSHFTLSFRQLVVDVNIVRDSLTVTRMEGDSNYRKVQFFSDAEFELYLKMELRRQIKKEHYTTTKEQCSICTHSSIQTKIE